MCRPSSWAAWARFPSCRRRSRRRTRPWSSFLAIEGAARTSVTSPTARSWASRAVLRGASRALDEGTVANRPGSRPRSIGLARASGIHAWAGSASDCQISGWVESRPPSIPPDPVREDVDTSIRRESSRIQSAIGPDGKRAPGPTLHTIRSRSQDFLSVALEASASPSFGLATGLALGFSSARRR